MIVRSVTGETEVIPDRFRYVNRIASEGTLIPSVLASKEPTQPQLERLVKKKLGKRKAGHGSIMGGTSPFGSSKDDTVMTYKQRRALRKLIFQNPHAFVYIMDTPREALYSENPYPLVQTQRQIKKGRGEEGIEAIEEWRELIEARRNVPTLERLSIWTAQYNRQYAEILMEKQYLRHPYLHLLGYPDNKMIGRLRLVSPLLLTDVEYKHGDLSVLTILGADGLEHEFTGDQLDRFIYFHNMPDNECRGVTRLNSLKRWLEGFDDLLEIILDIYYNDARLLEHHILNEAGLLGDDITQMWTDHNKEIDDTIDSQQRALLTNERIEIKLLGAQGRVLDPSQVMSQTKDYTHQGFQRPAAFVDAKNANKATIDQQKQHFQDSQLRPIDRDVVLRLWCEYVFPDVLRTRGMDVRLAPTIKFPPFKPASQLEQAIIWQTEVDTFGKSRMKQIAKEEGYEHSIDMEVVRKGDDGGGKRKLADMQLNKSALEYYLGQMQDLEK